MRASECLDESCGFAVGRIRDKLRITRMAPDRLSNRLPRLKPRGASSGGTSMKRSLVNFSIFSSLVLLIAMSASAQLQSHGTWAIDREGMHEAGKVHLNLYHSRKNQFGQDMALTNF